jgi:DNA-binding MarR family transcriptional regulator
LHLEPTAGAAVSNALFLQSILVTLYNIALQATTSLDSTKRLLRAYLDAVTLSESLQTRIWQGAQLTLGQVRVLRRLAKSPRSLSQLGSELALAPPSMTRLIDRLEGRGLIARKRDEFDRRKVVATLTDQGRQLVSAIPFLEGTAIRAAVERMTESERNRIASALDQFIGAVRLADDELVGAEIQ